MVVSSRRVQGNCRMSPVETDCLDRIRKGLIRLTPKGQVEVFRVNRFYTIKEHFNCCSGRRRFRLGKGYVYANRLMYLLKEKQEIPDGCFIDHIDGDRTNDDLMNLQVHSPTESHRQGHEKQNAFVSEKLGRWFELVSNLGREPALPHELTYLECGF